jgi:SpoVK/Ycf46/Vps4 family AAA+-type ATPase
MNTKRKKYHNNFNSPFKIDNFNKYLISVQQRSYQEKQFKPFPFEYVAKPEKKEIPQIKEININVELNDINDLINLISTYELRENVKYNINMKVLHQLKEPLIELNNMIGMKELKKNILDQIIYFVQELHKTDNNISGNNDNNADYMHTVIYGPPGTGKTEIAKIMGKIFTKINILSKGTFKKVTRSDLVAGYLGQTAIKTKEVIKECLGGVLFIDEAYSLGNIEKRDSFSKECIDTLCEALSDHKDNLMVIISGYETDLENCFFNYNQGLNSRFTWRFKIDDYTPEDLYNIFIKKVKDIGWSIHTNSISKINTEWFTKNKDNFKFYGRDIETFLAKTKIAHSRRVFCENLSEKKKITYDDMEKGLILYLNNNENKNKKENEQFKKQLQFSLYS